LGRAEEQGEQEEEGWLEVDWGTTVGRLGEVVMG